MDKCKSLMDYAILIEKIRTYENTEQNLEKAVERAIKECIEQNVLADYLRQYRSEVKNVILSEYDEQKHIENEKRWSYEDGSNDTNNLYKLLFKDGRIDEMEKAFDDKEFRHKLMQEYGLNEKME